MAALGPGSDDEIIARILEGDPDTVQLVRVWIRAAFSPYRGRLSADLEDLEQQILLDLTVALRDGRFEGRSRLRTYVRTHVHHKCIDRIRALSRREWVDIADLSLPSPARSVVDELSRNQTTELALRVQEEMPEACRELWRMIGEGLTYGEMSRRLEVAEGTLRVRVLRCRQKALQARERLLEAATESPSSTKR